MCMSNIVDNEILLKCDHKSRFIRYDKKIFYLNIIIDLEMVSSYYLSKYMSMHRMIQICQQTVNEP